MALAERVHTDAMEFERLRKEQDDLLQAIGGSVRSVARPARSVTTPISRSIASWAW
jgi:hypothetical protein